MKRINTFLVVLVVAAAGLTAWLATRDAPTYAAPTSAQDGAYIVGALPEDGEEPVRACADGLARALSYDHRSLDADLDRATGLMTAEFGKRFRTTFEKTTRKDALAKKIVTRSVVRGAGLVTSAEGKAECLTFLDQVLVRSTGIDEGAEPVKVSQNRVTVSLREVDGKWLVDDISPF